MRTLLTTLLLLSVALAGCSDGGGGSTTTATGTDPGSLGAGKGAIAGILVDDRFRPIELTANPQTEFQASGFILLQETGTRVVTTTPNGEFTLTNLDPGTYTLRASISGHEVTPTRVTVEEGVFAEANLLARRVVSTAGSILSYEYAAFSSCGFNVVAVGTPFDCTGDLSGDTDRAAFTVDYTGLNLTHVVMEMRANSPQYFDVWLRDANGDQTCGTAYQILGGPDTQYLRFQLNLGEAAPNDEAASGRDCESSLVWDNMQPLQTVMYLNSLGFDQEFPADIPIFGNHWLGYGAGAYLGVQANFLQSAFIGEPEVDVDSYCVYCG